MHTIPVQTWFQSTEAKVLRHAYVEKHFPALSGYSLKSLLGNCLYLSQLSMRCGDWEARRIIHKQTLELLEQYPLTKETKTIMTVKERFWMEMANKNLTMTCQIRNLLRIGL